jgi:hypothetical protein
MQFTTATNWQQTFFRTLEAQVAAEYPVRLGDSFMAALKAKKTTPPAKRFSTGDEKRRISAVCD